MTISRFEDLEVWRAAHQLTLGVYRLTESFPPKESYGLSLQMRRASVSVPSNIAEGFGRTGKREKIQFYNIAQGSLSELRYYCILAKDLGFLRDNSDQLESCNHIARMLQSLMGRIRERH